MNYEPRIPFFLIWRFITRSNKWTLSLTIFLMAVAFINLLFISSLFNGIVEGSNEQIINTYVGHVNITPPAGNDTIGQIASVTRQVLATPGVVAASPQTLVPAALRYGDLTISRQIVAIDPDQEQQVTNVATKMVAGSYLGANDLDGIILGQDLAGEPDDGMSGSSFKGAKVGQTIALVFNGTTKDFVIRGVFKTNFTNTDSRAFITRQALLAIDPGAADYGTNIIVKINKRGNELVVIDALRLSGIDATFNTWRDAAGLMKSVTKSFTSINVLMSFVGVLIAAVTIFIVIYIDISNKKRQIGILRAIGIKAYLIRATYVLQTAVYSVAGVLLGSAIFFWILVPYFNWHPFVLPICDATLRTNAADFIGRAEAVMLVAIVSGLIPAINVTRMKMLSAILGK